MRILSAVYIVAMVFGFASQAHAENLPWHTDYTAALQEARDTGKPLLVAFRCIP